VTEFCRGQQEVDLNWATGENVAGSRVPKANRKRGGGIVSFAGPVGGPREEA
jgi:hypothetical protein